MWVGCIHELDWVGLLWIGLVARLSAEKVEAMKLVHWGLHASFINATVRG